MQERTGGRRLEPLATSDVGGHSERCSRRHISLQKHNRILRHSPYDVTQIDSMADGSSTISNNKTKISLLVTISTVCYVHKRTTR